VLPAGWSEQIRVSQAHVTASQDPAGEPPDASVLSLPRAATSFTVIICAYTQQRWLATVAAIRSALDQTHQPHEIIVVVDHNDDLRSKLQREYPQIRVVANDQERGVSGARNCGARHASADVVVFLDDDALACPDWISVQAACLIDPHVLGVGGEVVPVWDGHQPRWFPDEFGWVVGYTHRGAPRGTTAVRNLTGGNMSVRRVAFDALGGFRAELGLVVDGESAPPTQAQRSQQAAACEDTEFCIRALQRWPDAIWLYHPEARIFHGVTSERAKLRYFLARCYVEGQAKASVAGTHVGARDGLANERRYVFMHLPCGIARHFRHILKGDAYGGARAGVIVGGVAVAFAGYVAATVSRFLPGTRSSSSSGTSRRSS
jgi:glycosyltransferase involved in cell wall biosynthesis